MRDVLQGKTRGRYMKVTAEQVKAAMIAADITRVEHHECSMCGYMTAYLREGEELYFDPGCYCTDGAGPEMRLWDDPAHWINMQDEEWSRKIADKFGIASSHDIGDTP